MKALTLMFLFFFFSTFAKAQNFGGNPPGKWGQINTDTVRVIFPLGLDSIANRVATLAHHLQRDSSYKYRYKKINIVLQNNATISNAYVSLAPYRSELYLMPPQNAFELGALSWADNLVVHEWRHVQQYNYFNRGLSAVAGAILGQEGRALFNAMSVPDWFFEGDAVWNETKYSTQGRGRLPLAFSGYKSLYLDGKDYSFMKLRNGSLKDMVPDHYDLGYLLVAYGAEKYGKDFWPKVTADASAFKPLFYPLQGAIKKYAGVPYKQFVQDALSYFHNQWKNEAQGAAITWLTKQNSYRTDYLFPYAGEAGNIIALKQSAKGNPVFIKIDAGGKETRIAAQGITLDRYYSYRNGRIVYAGYKTDARWTNREYSNIVLLDVHSGAQKKLGTRAKYFSPDITADGRQIVAVEMFASGASRLVFLDENGLELRTIDAGAGEVFSQPKFSADDNAVYVPVRNTKGWMSLRKYYLRKDLVQKAIIPFGNQVIGYPVVSGDTITFTATNKSNDDVYAFVESSEDLYHVASYPSGLYQSVLSGGRLVGSAFTSGGYRLGIVTAAWKKRDIINGIADLYVEKALDTDVDISKIETQRFAFRPYSKLSHPFNFHSWRPYYDPPEYSFTVYGQNVLNTLSTEIAYTYNENENNHKLSGNLIYGGTYIQPFAGVGQTWNRRFAFTPDTVAHWNEFEWAAGLQLPLHFIGGRAYRFLNISAGFHSNNITFTGSNKKLFVGTDINYIQTRVSFSSQVQKASMHIFPRFAVSGFLQHKASTNVQARQFLASGSMYLPGFARTHNIVLSVAYQGRDTMRQYGYTNNFPYPRGFDGGYDLPRMWKLGANYHFPLLHPDWGLANIIYFSRIRANAFTDYAELQSLRTKAVYVFQTAGAELYFDAKAWNQLPLTFGIRYNRVVTASLGGVPFNQWEFILPVNLIP
jgi:hypothetical protein